MVEVKYQYFGDFLARLTEILQKNGIGFPAEYRQIYSATGDDVWYQFIFTVDDREYDVSVHENGSVSEAHGFFPDAQALMA